VVASCRHVDAFRIKSAHICANLLVDDEQHLHAHRFSVSISVKRDGKVEACSCRRRTGSRPAASCRCRVSTVMLGTAHLKRTLVTDAICQCRLGLGAATRHHPVAQCVSTVLLMSGDDLISSLLPGWTRGQR